MPISSPTLFLNTTLVKWTPIGGTLVTLTRITQAGLTYNAEVINNRGDLDIYDSSAHIVGWKPTVTFAGNSIGAYLTMVPGIGAITWTIGNADNPGGTGSITFTMTPSMNPLGDYSGPHGQYASGNLSFMGVASDGLTNPLAYTVISSGSFVGASVPAPLISGGPMALKAGIPFIPRASKVEAPTEGTPVDAVILPMSRHARSASQFKNACRAIVEAASILKVDPDQVSVRLQGTSRIATASPAFSLKFPDNHDLSGDHRYEWHDRGDGVQLGYLTKDARSADDEAV